MKPQTEKPLSDQVMRFFTPELFIRFNSPDDEVADRADEEWEMAIQGYRSHLDQFRDQMPGQVKKLAELCLHDTEVLAIQEAIEPIFPIPFEPFPRWAGFAILSVMQDDKVVSLVYVLWDHVRKHPMKENWPFSKQRTHWLYDELDATPSQRSMFLHRILLSDGTVIEIPFVSVMIHSIPLQHGSQSDALRQIA